LILFRIMYYISSNTIPQGILFASEVSHLSITLTMSDTDVVYPLLRLNIDVSYRFLTSLYFCNSNVV